jgi:hypothetical protein
MRGTSSALRFLEQQAPVYLLVDPTSGRLLLVSVNRISRYFEPTSDESLCTSIEQDTIIPLPAPYLVIILHTAGFVRFGLLEEVVIKLTHVRETRLTRICGSAKYSFDHS